jgi:hypothetical protein
VNSKEENSSEFGTNYVQEFGLRTGQFNTEAWGGGGDVGTGEKFCIKPSMVLVTVGLGRVFYGRTGWREESGHVNMIIKFCLLSTTVVKLI